MSHHKSDDIKIKTQNGKSAQNFTRQPKKVQKARREKRPPKKITETYLHNSGLYYLQRFAASKNHFKTVMKRKVKRSCLYHTDQNYEDCAHLVDQLADKFEQSGLLNDDLYTRGMVSSLRRRGKSKTAILAKMRAKGITPERTIEILDILDEEDHDSTESAEKQAALKLARKKNLGPYYRGDKDTMDTRKALGVFARAGFSYDVARYVLNIDPDEVEHYGIL